MDDTVITRHPKMEMDGSDDFPLQRDDFSGSILVFGGVSRII